MDQNVLKEHARLRLDREIEKIRSGKIKGKTGKKSGQGKDKAKEEK